ncbi:MAG TPA: non-ribosomal peptide synthase/polyketide synthase [Thermoanaerobaculia bacterium]|nr:non-ribosomal peptide synthase/polyketide synthase [Thermoanaerobaculia bacterium]
MMYDPPVEGFPLSPQQKRLWSLEQRDGTYHTQSAFLAEGEIDRERLRQSFRQAAGRHEVFRTLFQRLPGMDLPLQVVQPELPVAYAETDLEHRGEDDREVVSRELFRRDREAGLDLENGPLVRLTLARLAPDRHLLCLTTPTLCGDARTHDNLVREIGLLYDAAGDEAGLDAAVQYVDVSEWQHELLASEEARAGRDFWRSQLPAGLDELAGRRLPFENGHGPASPCVPGSVTARLGREVLARVEALAVEQQGSPEAVLLAAWLALLARSGLGESLWIGRVHPGRTYEVLADAHGLFACSLPLRFRLDPEDRFTGLLARVEQALLRSDEGQEHFSWDDLTPRDGHLPYGFEYRGPAAGRRLAGAHLSRVCVESRVERFAIQLQATASVCGLELSIWHDAARVDARDAELLLDRLTALLGSALQSPARRVADLAILGTADRRLLAAWNDTARDVGEIRPLHRLFEAQAARAPQAEAVVWGGERLTYRELDTRADRLARRLVRAGAGPGSRVVIALERSAGQIVALLAAWKAGAAFVPVDPLQPPERQAHMLEDVTADGAPAVVVTVEDLVERLPATPLPVVLLGDPAEEALAVDLPVEVPPEAPAYVIFTSGSTGRPKGVVIRHSAVVNFAEALRRSVYSGLVTAGRPLRVSLSAPLAFDGSIKQILQLLDGHTLYLVPEEVRRDAQALVAFVREHRLDVLDCTPAQAGGLLDAGLLADPEMPPRLILLGGDKIVPQLWERLSRDPGRLIYNLYGPTECTVDATAERVGAVPFPSIGRSFLNVRTWVVDEALRPVPPEVWGELLIGGAGVGLGYVGRPDLTAERFLPDPFATEPGGRLYRTGDRVRLLRDGRLVCQGRLDHQVKLRGFRIELGEIESALAGHPGVARAVAVLREDGGRGARLVAYVALRAAEPGAEPFPEGRSETLRDFVRHRLPDYMVPSVVVVLPDLPLSRNGKVDRAALPAPEELRSAAERPAAPPRDPFEEVLAGIWAELLGQPRVGLEENFFELGGHSLLGTRLVSRVREAFHVELPLRALFEGPTIAALAQRVRAAFQAGAGLALPVLRPAPREGDLPLSFAQQRLWFLWQLEPDSPAYNNPKALRIRGDLDPGVVERTLGEIVRRHEVLRTTFPAVDGRPVQRIDPAARLPLPVEDLSHLPDPEEQARRIAGAEARRPFDLAREIPVRGQLLLLAPRDHVLLLTTHHIASDAWSVAVLEREVTVLYEAFAAGRPSPLPELPVQYADFAEWQRAWLQGEALDRQLAYWRGQLSGAPPVLDLPFDRPRPPVASPRGELLRFSLPAELSRSISELSRQRSVTLFMPLLAAFQTLLARISGQSDLSVGTPIAGRRHLETEGLIGFFVNTLVMRSRVEASRTFEELLGQVRDLALQAYAHQDLPFERLVDELAPERSLEHSPLFQVLFVLQNVERSGVKAAGLELSPFGAEAGVAKLDLSLSLTGGDEGLSGVLEYRTALFDRTTIARLATHLLGLLDGAATAPEARLGDLPLLTPAERHQLLAEWNDTAEERGEETLLDRIWAQVVRAPGAVAVASAGEVLTYAELDRRAERLAQRLARLGVGPEILVGICAGRSPALLVALLAVLKAGGAYVPLDPTHPPERLGHILEDSGARVLLTERALLGGLPPHPATAVLLDEEEGEAPRVPLRRALPENLAYVIYTSGSTGRPKGVAVRHRGVANYLATLAARPGLAAGDVMLAVTTVSFDIAVTELLLPLTVGARIELVSRETASDGVLLAAALESAGATCMQATPATWTLLVDGGWPGRAGLCALCGGEALPRALADKLLPRVAELWNVYGPTETTVWSSLARVTSGQGPVPAGLPLGNTTLHLLTCHGELAPLGAAGELAIGGDGLARGYHGRPDLTAERFVPDPFGPPGGRLYRTGDLARRRPGGELELLGRIDHQIKLRGVRIEPGEIEAVLLSLPGIREAAVVAREDRPGDRRLVAYLSGGEAPEAGLRERLRGRLPSALVPSRLVWLDALPRLPNGKLDRRALPVPGDLPSGEVAGPRDAFEEVLAGIWAELLGLPQVGTGASFFELGGHSLLATRLISRIREAFRIEIPLRALFEGPTVAALAERVRAAVQAGAGLELPPIRPLPRHGELPLSFAQQRLWFLQQLEPDSAAYNISQALRIRGPLDVAAAERTLQEIVRRHEVLRTTFPAVDGRPVQRIEPAARLDLPVRELPPGPDGEERAREAFRAEAQRPFDLAHEIPLRAELLRLGPGDHVLLLTTHHIASDAWSVAVLEREVTALYEAFAAGRPSPLPELTVQYADFARWQREWLQGEVLERQLAAWRDTLAGAPPVLELPLDRPRPPVASPRGERLPFALPAALSRSLAELGRSRSLTRFMTLLAGFQALLARSSGQSDLSVGTPIAGRRHVETEGLIGFFVNTLVMRVRLDAAWTFEALLAEVRDLALLAYTHQDLPFERLVDELAPERSLQHTPLFQVMLVLQNVERSGVRAAGLELSPFGGEPGVVKLDLLLSLIEEDGGIRGELDFRTELFDRTTIARMAGHLVVLLENAAAAPQTLLSDLALLTPAERHQLVAEWNDTVEAREEELTLLDRIEAQVARAPEAVAVACEGEAITYAELDESAERLARRLARLGVGPEILVGVCAGRSPMLLVALLAVLKAGGAYVPLDPDHPRERLGHILGDSGARVLLTEQALLSRLPTPEATVVLLDGDPGEEPGAPLRRALPENLAYVIYTSGSTGQPKGVAVRHRGVTNYLATLAARPGLTAGDVMMAVTTVSFDIAITELFLPLTVGARIELVSRETASDAALLGAALESAGATCLQATPATWTLLVEGGWLGRPGLKALCGGEALPRLLADKLLPRVAELWNVYGPTEATVWSALVRVGPGERAVPVGLPLGNTAVHLLARHGELVPLGAAGELAIGGDGLARGYHGRPDLTAERFVPDPFGAPGARLYRTGDLARRRSDGSLELLGRIDHQVKIRGFRIEPGEIEAVLATHPRVRECAVVARQDGPGVLRLVGYVVPHADAVPEAAELRGFLGERLPSYMVPAAFVLLGSLPLSPNGKLDRTALPEPSRESAGPGDDVPRTLAEITLAGIWEDVLGVARIGLHDNFFELGGDSILSVQIVARAHQKGLRLTPRQIFERPTVSGLASLAERAVTVEAEARVPFSLLEENPGAPDLPEDAEDAYPLSPMQEGILFHSLFAPGSGVYVSQVQYDLEPLDLRAFRTAWEGVIARQPVLRTGFLTPAGSRRPIQVVQRAVPSPLRLEDGRGLPGERLEEIAESERQAGFELSRPPLMRLVLVRVSETGYHLVWTHHHLLMDGWSVPLLLRELLHLYRAAVRQEPAQLPEARPYRDYIAFVERQDSRKAEELWRRTLAGFTAPTPLPVRRRPGACGAAPEHRWEQSLWPAESLAMLEAFARRHRLTSSTLVQAAWALLLCRSSGSDDVVFGAVSSGRPAELAGVETMIGLFINTLPVRVKTPPRMAVLPWLRSLQADQTALREVEHAPLVEVQRWSEVPAGTPLFESLVVFENYPVEEGLGRDLGELEIRHRGRSEKTSYPLNLMVVASGELSLSLEHDARSFDAVDVRRSMGHLEQLLRGLLDDPARPLEDLPLLSEGERHQILREWNDTATLSRPTAGSLQELFEVWVERAPEAPAVLFGDRTWTYAEIDLWANRWAFHLRRLGVGPGSFVAVYLDRGWWMIPAVLAVLKAGGAYVPLDGSHPPQRVARILSSMGIRWMLSQGSWLARISGRLEEMPCLEHVLCLEEEPADIAEISGRRIWRPAELAEAPRRPLPSVTSPDDPAYVIFTSGSSGTPKGVLVQHRPVLNLIDWVNRTFEIGPLDRVLFVTSLGFDLSVYDIFGLLAAGGSIRVASSEDLGNPQRLLRYLLDDPVTYWDSAPAALQQLSAFLPEEPVAESSLRRVFLSGDWIPVLLPDRVRAAFPGTEVVSLGGATEATVWSNFHRIREVDPAWSSIPYGRPIQEARYYILDERLEPCPIGVAGGLYIGGGCLSQGYAGEPALTADRYLPDPFGDTPGGCLYRTGDEVRLWGDGTLEFLGRRDQQVKIRGFRIELGEIEVALRQQPGIREAVVVVREDQPGNPLLVAYVAGDVFQDTDLRERLRDRLPSWMVPSRVVRLDALPLTSNGKVDRRTLAQIAPERSTEEFVAPRTPEEQTLAGLFIEILGAERTGGRVGLHDNFFELGGHSLMATRLMAAISDAFEVELPLRAVFELPTLERLAQAIATAASAPRSLEGAVTRVPREPGINRFPVSFAQLREWILDRLEPGNPAYNIPSNLRIGGLLSIPVLTEALNGLVQRHEVFRTALMAGDEEPLQAVLPEVRLQVPVLDLAALPVGLREDELWRQVREQARTGFDLSVAPLLCARVVRLDAEDHALLLTVHHIISDGWSMGIFNRELAVLYEACAAGAPPPLPLQVQYADYAVWLRRRLASGGLEQQLGYWKERLTGAPPLLDLPTDRPRPPVRSSRGGKVFVHLPRELSERLEELALRQGATLFMVLLAAFQAVLARWSGQDDIVVGTYSGNRPRRELEGLIGFFINTLVLRTDLSGDPSFADLVGRVRETTLGAFANQDVPFEKLLEILHLPRDPSRTPLFQALLVLQNFPPAEADLSTGVRLSAMAVRSEKSDYDLALWLEEGADGITGNLEFSSDLFDRETMTRLGDQLRILLEAAVADSGRNVWSLPLVKQEERARQLEAWSRGPAVPVGETVLHRLVEEQAVHTPDAIALEAGTVRLTYAELVERAGRMASRLRESGAGPGTIVALSAERSAGLIVSMLAVLQAGAAYLPIDPAYPQERRDFMLADSGAAVLEDSLGGQIPRPPSHPNLPLLDAGPESPAYVIYTSGSTGRPKGVVVPHRAISSFVRGFRDGYGISPGDRVLQFASVSFDTSAEEIWPALTAGATLVLRPENMAASIPHFVREVERLGITVLDLPTAFWHEMAAGMDTDGLDLPRGLRLVILGGEEALAGRLALWNRRAGPSVQLVNTYGPTETTIVATRRDLSNLPSGGAIPIGRPIAGARAYLLDRFCAPVPPGVRAELWIGGAGVAQGYLGRPDLTAERFVPDPFGGEPGARLYRTGDLAILRPDGDLVFAGRADRQLKVRGYRIEPGEIEAALLAEPGVREVVVVVREDRPGDRRLVAYLVGDALEASALRERLRSRLPAHMVPALFVRLDALPLSPNGKVDRPALPAPEGERPELRAGCAAPSTPAEQALAEIWCQVLRIERIGVHDDFFELGGDSLLAVRLLARLREVFRVEVPLRTLFEAPTVAELAPRISALLDLGDRPAAPPVVRVTEDRGRDFAPSFAQQRLWFLDQLEPGNPFYSHRIGVRLIGRLDIVALEKTLTEVLRRHEILRTTLPTVDGQPVQRIAPPHPVRLPWIDLSGLGEEQAEQELRLLSRREELRSFELSRGPLLRFALFRLAPERNVILLTLHHVIIDAWSIGLLVREVATLYQAFAAGRPSPLPELPIQYADFAEWQRRWLRGEVLDGHLAYWKRHLAGSWKPLEVPGDRPRPARMSYRGASLRLPISPELSRQVEALSRREGVTSFMTLLAAFDLLMARLSGQEDVVVGMAVANRTRAEIENLIGFFVNMLPLRVDLSGSPTFRELLQRVREVCLGAQAHQDLPLDKLVEAVRPERNGGDAPLFRIAFGQQNTPHEALEVPGLQLLPWGQAEETVRFDLTVWIFETGAGFSIQWAYSTELFDESTPRRLHDRFARLLGSIVERPDAEIDRLEMLSAEERKEQARLENSKEASRHLKLLQTRTGKLHRAAPRERAPG